MEGCSAGFMPTSALTALLFRFPPMIVSGNMLKYRRISIRDVSEFLSRINSSLSLPHALITGMGG
jgi:hypothetical protein